MSSVATKTIAAETAEQTVEPYRVRLDVFEGPLDLLLHLIKREELNIYDIPIAKVTEQYLAYIYDLSGIDVDRASEYLVMAATLVGIKSRMLLPKPPKEEPLPDDLERPEDHSEDPRAELVRQLVEYQQFKTAAEQLKGKEQTQARCYRRGYYEDLVYERPLEGLSLGDLVEAFEEILEEEWNWREVPREEIPLREKLREIKFRLSRSPHGVRFRELFPRHASKLEVVVTFLALLELMRLRKVLAEQEMNFGEIIIKRAPAPARGESPQGEGTDPSPWEEEL